MQPQQFKHLQQSQQSLQVMDDLFHAQNVKPPAEDIPQVTVQAVVSPPKRTINSLFKLHEQLESEVTAKIEKMKEIERELVGTTLTEDPDFKSAYAYEHAAFEALLNTAQRTFAPPNINLGIKRDDVLEETGQTAWDSRDYYRKGKNELNIDLDKVWTYLVNRYSGDNGKKIVLQKVANRIIYLFNLRNSTNITRTASHVACELRVFGEKKSCGQYEAGYHYQKSTIEIFNALQAFTEHAELDELSISLSPVRNEMAQHSYRYDLRHKTSFKGLDVVTQKEVWIFRFSHEVAAKLMLFIGEFGQVEE